MARPWLKLWTVLLGDPRVRRCNAETRGVYFSLLLLAGQCDVNGALCTGEVAFGAADLADYFPAADRKRLGGALGQLVAVGLLVQIDAVYHVADFATTQETRAAERMRKKRNTARTWREHGANGYAENGVTVTHNGANSSHTNGVTVPPDPANSSELLGVTRPAIDRREKIETTETSSPSSRLVPIGADDDPISITKMHGKQLPLPDAVEIAAREVLAAIWPRVEPLVSRTTTRTAWGQRNKAVALDLVRAGRTLPEILAAHDAASLQFGSPVFMLKFVQTEMLRQVAPGRPKNRRSVKDTEPGDITGGADYAAKTEARMRARAASFAAREPAEVPTP